ncbi:MAG: hypothetical protein FWH02_07305 [Oscillospiraceae bacterium]|nr:hypothetical protein [Oscillospiraceae bacterium]
MSATIFCTFDQQDLADLAIGRIRSGVKGIHDVKYLNGFEDSGHSATGGDNAGFFGWAVPFGYTNNAAIRPSRPVDVKIVCDDSVRHQIAARLVNQHAYKIVVS